MKRIVSLLNPVFAGFFVLSLSACTSDYPKLVNRPVMKVNEKTLTTRQFANQLARRLKDLDSFTAKDPQIVEQAKEQIMNDFIVNSLILDWAQTQKIEVSDAEVDKAVAQYRANYPDDLSFRRILAHENLSFSEWREKLHYSLVEQAVFKKINEKVVPPTEVEIKKYFEEKKDRFRKKERVYIRQILLEDMARAEFLRSNLRNKDFAKLAQEYSRAPEAKAGGLVGWLEKGSVDFLNTVFSLPAGAISQIIQSPFGYHIVKVEKKLPAALESLDEARPQIIRQLLAQKEQAEFVAWLDRQIRSSKVLKDYDLIKAINVDTKGKND